jgi:hypothetical protein
MGFQFIVSLQSHIKLRLEIDRRRRGKPKQQVQSSGLSGHNGSVLELSPVVSQSARNFSAYSRENEKKKMQTRSENRDEYQYR